MNDHHDHDGDDALERRLLRLTKALRRADPTPAWKAEILARARQEARATPSVPRLTPPRWLALSWAAAWGGILLLHLSAPREEGAASGHRAVAEAKLPPTPARATGHDALLPGSLLALQRRHQLELP